MFLLQLAAREPCGGLVGSGPERVICGFFFFLITVLPSLKGKQTWVGFPVLDIQALRTRLIRWKFRTVWLVRSKPPQVLFFLYWKKGRKLKYDSETLLETIVLSLN